MVTNINSLKIGGIISLLFHHFYNLTRIRKATKFFLGKQQQPIYRDLKHTT